jgi:hypothetical protein
VLIELVEPTDGLDDWLSSRTKSSERFHPAGMEFGICIDGEFGKDRGFWSPSGAMREKKENVMILRAVILSFL